jgi:hypothetical protein
MNSRVFWLDLEKLVKYEADRIAKVSRLPHLVH